MPPKTANLPNRKGPAFKPPRPVKESAASVNGAGITKRVSGATTARSAGITKTTAAAQRKAPMVINSSDDEDDDPFSIPDEDELMDDVPADEDRDMPAHTQLEPIPQRLLGRLLQEGFEDENTKIHRGAMELTTKYMDIFVREAISRAVIERREANKARGGGGISDGFLQVEDLEKLAPQLVLDF